MATGVLAALGAGDATMQDDLAALPPLTEACAVIARDRPVLLMVDDAHWCGCPIWLRDWPRCRSGCWSRPVPTIRDAHAR